MVCRGAGCHVTLTNVTFKQCTLVAIAGASVALSNCSFELNSNNPSRSCGGAIGIVASGQGTSVRADACYVRRGTQGISVQLGAKLEASGLTVTETTRIGIEVTGPASSAHLSNCMLAEFKFKFPGHVSADSAARHGESDPAKSNPPPSEAPGSALANVLAATEQVAGFGVYVHSEGYVNL